MLKKTTYSKLLWLILGRKWNGDIIAKRLRTRPLEARQSNEFGDLPLHFACYKSAPLAIVISIIESYPEAVFIRNRAGFTPLQIAEKNYSNQNRDRDGVLDALQRVLEEREESAPVENTEGLTRHSLSLDHTFRSTLCVICMDRAATHVVIPCGHLCLCGSCQSSFKKRRGQVLCPMGRCTVESIVRMQEPESQASISME
mmetsp:Transcript_52054/g.77131  ORF Transcript_52054/g.77131 Transcript_52054/m.77131 type:complete len:200 (+) Transcript_52054:253-852(+)